MKALKKSEQKIRSMSDAGLRFRCFGAVRLGILIDCRTNRLK